MTQNDLDVGKRYLYTINCRIKPFENGGLVLSTFSSMRGVKDTFLWVFSRNERVVLTFIRDNLVNATSIHNIATFYITDLTIAAPPNPFLTKSKKYSCFDLVRKALLTCDTHIIDNSLIGLDSMYNENGIDTGLQYPIEIDPAWMIRLKEAELHETIFENKNLWEILLQIGYYLHAPAFCF